MVKEERGQAQAVYAEMTAGTGRSPRLGSRRAGGQEHGGLDGWYDQVVGRADRTVERSGQSWMGGESGREPRSLAGLSWCE